MPDHLAACAAHHALLEQYCYCSEAIQQEIDSASECLKNKDIDGLKKHIANAQEALACAV